MAAEYDGPLYETECLDLCSWLRAHRGKGDDLRIHQAKKLAPGRTKFFLRDPMDRAEDLALEFADSVAASVLEERKKLISLSKSGRAKDR